MLAVGPWRLELEGILSTGGAGSKCFLGLEGIERSPRQWLHAGKRRQSAVLSQGGVGHGGVCRFQRSNLRLGERKKEVGCLW